MMLDWLAGLDEGVGNEAAVLVTVAIVEGSGPREAGTKMLVTQGRQFGTIGGGHLELRALEIARGMLAHAGPVSLQRFPLGPSLGQCCGGVVHLLFEPLGAALAAVLQRLRDRRREDSWRLSAVDGQPVSVLCDAQAEVLVGASPVLPQFTPSRASHLLRDSGGRRWLVDACLAPRAHLTLFGAGHVGAAIVRALAELPCHVTWVDEREDMFPPTVPENVAIEVSDTPEALVAEAPPGASFLVMTHNHALDMRLSEAILARADAGWFGLIGSKTKRMQFEHRLQARGCAPERVKAMVCPIGLAGIGNKAPPVLAASVVAQLLMVWEAEELAAAPSLLGLARPQVDYMKSP